jgi:hypothetical protein
VSIENHIERQLIKGFRDIMLILVHMVSADIWTDSSSTMEIYIAGVGIKNSLAFSKAYII